VTALPALPRLAGLTVGGRLVAEYVDGAALPPELSPRPFLHPVRTLSGVVVSEAAPPDHPWHLGVGVAVQDVSGTNLWGGRTYVRDTGYVWRGDHGSIRHVAVSHREAAAFHAELDWCDPAGVRLLRETRTFHASTLHSRLAVGTWLLDLTFTLINPGDRPVELGSPATNGRPGGGYGGFFWRLPALQGAQVRTPDTAGEEAVHGSRGQWLALTGSVEGQPVTLAADQPGVYPRDRWFVRLAGYPGFGASLAAEQPVRVPAGGRIRRRVRVIVADGVVAADILGRRPAGVARTREGTRERMTA
jgi:hypothetical protein